MIVNTKKDFIGIFEVIFSGYKKVRDIPFHDKFILIKDLPYKDVYKLDKFMDYIVISRNFYDKFWDREEFIKFLKENVNVNLKKGGERRVFKHRDLDNKEFAKNVKLYYYTKRWRYNPNESSFFNLFKSIGDESRVYIEYYKLRKSYAANQVFYGLLTFVNKSLTKDIKDKVNSYKYYNILQEKRVYIIRNFRKAIRLVYSKDITDEDYRNLLFLKILSSK